MRRSITNDATRHANNQGDAADETRECEEVESEGKGTLSEMWRASDIGETAGAHRQQEQDQRSDDHADGENDDAKDAKRFRRRVG